LSTTPILQFIIALGLLNVWIVRFNRATDYRGGEAKNLVQEFAVYGLSKGFCYLIGFIKVSSAIALLLGFWYPQLVLPAASVILVLMLGALAMHFKVRDPVKKSIPASAVLLLSAIVCLGSM
jgi:hypothetical protein